MAHWLLLALIVIATVVAAMCWLHIHARLVRPLQLVHAGFRFDIRVVQARGHVLCVIWRLPWPGSARWRLRPRRWADRVLVWLGLARAANVGDAAVSRHWLLECDDEDLAAGFDGPVSQALDACRRDLRDKQVRLTDLSSNGRSLTFRTAPFALSGVHFDRATEPLAPLGALAGTLHREGLQQRTMSPAGRPRLMRAGAVRGAVLVAAVTGFLGLTQVVEGDPDSLDPFKVMLASLYWSMSFFAVLLLACWHAFRARREGARALTWLLVYGLPAFLLAGHAMYREGNMRLDQGQPRGTTVLDARLHWSRTAGFTHSWLTLPGGLSPAESSRRLRLSYRAHTSLGLSWPPRGDDLAISVQIMPGAFGHPWVSCIERLPEPIQVAGIPLHEQPRWRPRTRCPPVPST